MKKKKNNSHEGKKIEKSEKNIDRTQPRINLRETLTKNTKNKDK